ncbi:unnamed protein product [Polarella glacialis]|uniref:Uncharacterized protein n=1 Tax=Polarella glacialis TaxID=89957 RepID=A0A813LG34_POLGL|nr:unnamed protein product [Polarella glacialis]
MAAEARAFQKPKDFKWSITGGEWSAKLRGSSVNAFQGSARNAESTQFAVDVGCLRQLDFQFHCIQIVVLTVWFMLGATRCNFYTTTIVNTVFLQPILKQL